MCVCLFPAKVTVLGAQVAPDEVTGALMRLYEFIVGLVIEQISAACSIRPPSKL